MMIFSLLSALYARAFGSSNYEAGLTIAPTSDGGFIVAGQTYGVGAGDYDIVVIKMSPVGTAQWIRTYGGPGWEAPGAIITTTDGGYAVAGGTGSWGAGSYDALVFKLNSDGSVAWARVFGGSSYEMLYDIIQVSDGYAVCGYTSSIGSGESDFLLLKLGTNGALSWGRVFGSIYDETSFGVAQTPDGGYAVVGETEVSGTDWDALAVKYTSTGTFGWARRISAGTMPERACEVIPVAGDSLAIGGFTLNSGTGYYMFWFFKMSGTGSLGWGRAYGGGNTTYCYDMVSSGDGGFLLGGETRASGAGGFDYGFMKINSAGTLQWARTWGTTSADDGYHIALGTDGIGMTGWTYGIGPGGGDILILKTDLNGNYPACVQSWSPSTISPTMSSASQTGGSSWTPTNSAVSLTTTSPNWTPTDACVPVEASEEQTRPQGIICVSGAKKLIFISDREAELRVYSVDGSLAFSKRIRHGENDVQLAPGVYIWKAGPWVGRAILR
ncbi:MAG: hypothetical protein ABIN66_07945 [candidate division WOR-3 bacterium]